MSEKAMNLLGLMRRAGALATGESNAGTAVRGGKAKLLLLASDASENALRRAESLTFTRKTQTVALPYTKDELAAGLGTGECAMAAVTDMGFANALMKLLLEAEPERYAEAAAETERRSQRAQRRKAGTPGGDSNNRNGKRRTNI